MVWTLMLFPPCLLSYSTHDRFRTPFIAMFLFWLPPCCKGHGNWWGDDGTVRIFDQRSGDLVKFCSMLMVCIHIYQVSSVQAELIELQSEPCSTVTVSHIYISLMLCPLPMQAPGKVQEHKRYVYVTYSDSLNKGSDWSSISSAGHLTLDIYEYIPSACCKHFTRSPLRWSKIRTVPSSLPPIYPCPLQHEVTKRGTLQWMGCGNDRACCRTGDMAEIT